MTNIDSTCQGITIYDIIIRCKKNPPPPPHPQNNWGGILEKIYLFKVLFLKIGVNKWMQLVVLPSTRHNWPKKKSYPPQSLKNYKWWFVKTFHLSTVVRFGWGLSRDQGAPTNHELSNQKFADRHSLFYISNNDEKIMGKT